MFWYKQIAIFSDPSFSKEGSGLLYYFPFRSLQRFCIKGWVTVMESPGRQNYSAL
jgi:hypothetical protein